MIFAVFFLGIRDTFKSIKMDMRYCDLPSRAQSFRFGVNKVSKLVSKDILSHICVCLIVVSGNNRHFTCSYCNDQIIAVYFNTHNIMLVNSKVFVEIQYFIKH